MGLVEYVQTHKTWSVLWACFALFWFIGFGYYCAKMDAVVYDGHPYYMEFIQIPAKGEGREWPAWIICPGGESDEKSLSVSCNRCLLDGMSMTACVDGGDKVPSHSPERLPGCITFNNEASGNLFEGGRSTITCDINYTNADKARIYLFDQNWNMFQEREEKHVFPNGAVMHTLPPSTRTLLGITRELYKFSNGEDETTYVLLDGEQYQDNPSPSQSSLMIYYGTRNDRVYTQSANKIKTGYDFWYWIGFIGGISFFCYSLHSIIYAIICIALGWKNEDDDFASI